MYRMENDKYVQMNKNDRTERNIENTYNKRQK